MDNLDKLVNLMEEKIIEKESLDPLGEELSCILNLLFMPVTEQPTAKVTNDKK